ncbi:MFS transporter [Paenibacillus barengoltzii]|uniref:MFS transporter n=1 Tax=Paenibacillus barengoltzii TaxID=343517 RepID=UPI002FD88112
MAMAKRSSQFWALFLFSIGVFMAQLDNGIISAALTTINRSFDVSANWGAWGITIYTLGLAISLPIVGKLSDRYGRKKLFIVEIALFGIGSLLVALSPSFGFYLFARVVQALGGGGIFIIGSSHILSTVEPDKQAKYLGLLGAMNGIAAVLGPNIGSLLLELTGKWHVLFLINVPIAIVLFILGLRKLEESSDPSPGRLDLIGTIILSLGILSLMLGLTNIDVDFAESLTRPNVWGYLLGGVVLITILLFFEGKMERNQSGDPILPVRLIKQPRYLMVLLIGTLSGGLLAAMIYIPSFTEQVLGIAAENSGYWMTPLALAAGIGAGLGGMLVSKRGPVFTVIMSGLIAAIGFMLFPLWLETRWQFIIASAIAGVGIGVILGAPLNILATEGLKKDKGSALASLSLLRQIGMTLAPAIYAGFIARAFNNMGTLFAEKFPGILQQNLANVTLSAEAQAELAQIGQHMSSGGSGVSESELSGMLQAIQDPTLKQVLVDSVGEITKTAAQTGFSGLYWTAAILGMAIIVGALVLIPLRKKSPQDLEVTEETV